ncbi:response regulator, partial [bacterium]|nr:response regulator [bacterium]
KKESILILDDEQDLHYVFDRYLGERYDLIHALTMEDALKIGLKSTHIDLVITDIFLPENKTGFEFVYKIRELNKEVPIIIMSAYGDQFTSDLIENIKDTFVCYFINKPFDNDEMETLIEKVLGKKKA